MMQGTQDSWVPREVASSNRLRRSYRPGEPAEGNSSESWAPAMPNELASSSRFRRSYRPNEKVQGSSSESWAPHESWAPQAPRAPRTPRPPTTSSTRWGLQFTRDSIAPKTPRPPTTTSTLIGGLKLPPMVPCRTEPEQTFKPSPPDVSAQRYLRSCEKQKTMPALLPLIAGNSPRLNAASLGLMDRDLLAFASVVRNMAGLEEINLENNRLLTEKGMVPFIQKLFGEPTTSSLRSFVLKRCQQIGQVSLIAVIELLSGYNGARCLQQLDLSGVPLGMGQQLSLCGAIAEHPTLIAVYLADTGFGVHSIAKQCVGELFRSESLQALDLSWNLLSVDVFKHLGVCIVESDRLQSLGLSHCTAGSAGTGENPIDSFIESMAMDRSLKRLDLSMNRLSVSSALVVEDAFELLPALSELDVSGNPLGTEGLRSILRVLSRRSSGLRRFRCDDCKETTRVTSIAGTHRFSMTNPGRRYDLQLARPDHRSLLRMLYKLCARLNLVPDDAFLDVSASEAPYRHPARSADGIWRVPVSGSLSFTFSILKARTMESDLQSVDGDNFTSRTEFLESHFRLTKMQPAFVKVVPLLANWKVLDSQSVEAQLLFLDALSKDFLLEYPQIEVICEGSTLDPNRIVQRLMPCMTGGACTRYLATLLMHKPLAYIRLMADMSNFFGFNPDHPTGHYNLHLENSGDHAVAERLLLLDLWAHRVSVRRGDQDTSQYGNRSQFRNTRFDGEEVGMRPLAQFGAPEEGLLEFDYVGIFRPASHAKPLDQERFEQILGVLRNSEQAPRDCIAALRMVAHQIHVTALQLRGLLHTLGTVDSRVDASVLLYLRLVDVHNEKVIRVCLEHAGALPQLYSRLGYAIFCPIMQPEREAFVFVLSIPDQRIAASAFISLSLREQGDNLKSPSFTAVDGTVDPLPLGVPRLWEDLANLPMQGTFCMTYVCAPESRCFDARQRTLRTLGQWRSTATEQQVMWWSSIREVPADVVELLAFLLTKFSDISKAFTAIDGPHGNESIGRRELELGLDRLECKKFKGPKEAPKQQRLEQEQKRLDIVFSYLDPSGERQVSPTEWDILNNLWKEVRLLTVEFVQFLERLFPAGLSEAWQALDGDGSGALDDDEFRMAVERNLGFFGDARPVFMFMDKDGEGTVSEIEFQALSVFWDSS